MEQPGTLSARQPGEPLAPQAPVIVLGKHDDFLTAEFTALTALDVVKGALDSKRASGAGAAEADDYEFFDAAGRRLQWVKELDALAVADEQDHRVQVRGRAARMFSQLEPELTENPGQGLSPFDLPDADSSFELFAWRLAATLSNAAAGADGRGGLGSTERTRLSSKFGGRKRR